MQFNEFSLCMMAGYVDKEEKVKPNIRMQITSNQPKRGGAYAE